MRIPYSPLSILFIISTIIPANSCKNNQPASTILSENGLSRKALNCEQLSSTYNSYDEAITAVKNAKFELKDKLGEGQSSWIHDAYYFSCDGNSGYLIIVTSKKEYIHKEVPVAVWDSFKNADSKGSYYNNNIKGRFQFSI